ncbi:MAG TPA: SGNH/GDSL hydrolase family protein [Pseudonocardiaceae bacterium]|nr:SGNH/GDSL hydrolase family protein [Pseudonocardiaceae bacterium]
MAAETFSVLPAPPIRRPISSLAVLGDSTAVGMGDPLPSGGWRGFGPLLAAALGAPDNLRYTNLSAIGARMADLRRRQLPAALVLRPDVAVILAGMNDTLRSDFDGAAICRDLGITVAGLQDSGAIVLVTRYHEHGRVFRLPGPLRRALHHRIEQLNHAADHVVAERGALCLDLHVMPGAYETPAWSVDRLHPSELGHRMLARGYADLLAGAGIIVPHPVGRSCAGGRQLTTVDHVGWLALRGLPWLIRRSRDLVPHAAGVMLRDLLGLPAAVPSRCVR